MTRSDVMASSRTRTAATASKRRGSSSAPRALAFLSLALLCAAALVAPATAVAASTGLTGYGQTPTTPTTPTTKTTPTTSTEPTTTTPTTTPTTAAKSEKASTLPFTGFDLRWTIGIGVLLIAMGGSIVLVQSRVRRDRGN